MIRLGSSGVALALTAALAGSATAQTASSAPATPGARVEAGYTAPRTSFGQPDLQGVWSNASNTRLTRPPEFKSLVMTDAEAAAAQASHPLNIRQQNDDNQKLSDGLLDGSDLARGRGYNAFWIDPGTNYGLVKGTWRTSWIVSPQSGQIPFSEGGRKLMADARTRRGTGYDNPEERSLGERCIIGFGGTGGPPMMNVLYNNHYQIVQSPDAVVIMVEMNHDARIIPLRGSHRPGELAPYLGDSIGWWEGDTLVVETRNLHPMQSIGNTAAPIGPEGKINERFTRYNDRQILYEFTVEDPTFYTEAWRGEMSLNALDEAIFEYACHEGNYGLEGILAGGRMDDQRGVVRQRALGEEG